MTLSECLLTRNDCYKDGRKIVPRGVMVHSTGVAQPDPDVFVRAWNKPGVEVAVHAIVSQKGVYQCLPWDCRGWHAGGAANNTHIGFEICEPAGHTYQGGTMVGYDAGKNAPYFDTVYRSAVELTAMLCAAYGLDPLANGVVICHSEGHQRGIASNHSDVMQWFPKHGKSMDTFRRDVANQMKGEEDVTQEQFNQMMESYLAQQRTRETSEWAAKAWKKAKTAGVFDGTSPRGPLSREQAALVLDRLGLLPEQGGG